MDIGGNPSALFDKTTGKLLLQFVRGLLERDPATRLGAKGEVAVQKHPFFSQVIWPNLLAKKLTPPIRPCEGLKLPATRSSPMPIAGELSAAPDDASAKPMAVPSANGAKQDGAKQAVGIMPVGGGDEAADAADAAEAAKPRVDRSGGFSPGGASGMIDDGDSDTERDTKRKRVDTDDSDDDE